MKRILPFLFLLIFIPKIKAQEYFPNNESVQNKNKNFIAFINAKIYITPTQIIEKGTLLIQDGKVIAVGSSASIPKNTVTIDLVGKSIYPSFIDMYTSFGANKPQKSEGSRQNPLYDTKREGYYWNEHIRSEINTSENFKYDKTKAEEYLKAGFGIVGTHIFDGVAQGTGMLIALNNDDKTNTRVLSNAISNHFGFSRSTTTNQAYPSSLMGMMALLRQMYLDLDWYKKGNSTTKDLSLEALIKNEKLVQIFSSEDKLNSLRASKLANEFGLKYILKGAGNEFERIDEIKKTNTQYIIPINFPEAFDVSNPYQASQLDYSDLIFWNQAPTNLKVLSENNIVFALTTDKLKKIDDFRSNLLKTIQYGFDKTKALEALTTVPATLLGKSNEIGSLKTGTWANFLITSGEIFDKETVFYENWTQGNKYVINDMQSRDLRGNYDLKIDNETFKWVVKGEITTPSSEIATLDTTKLKSKLSLSNKWISLIIKSKDTTKNNFYRLTGYIDNETNLSGKALLFNGKETSWTAIKTSPYIKEKDTTKIKNNKIIPVAFPNLAFGNSQKLKQQTILFKNATVWTNEKEGILKQTDVLVKDGKIKAIGSNLSEAGATVIDAKGKHLTSGIIDEHSHIAISNGVNESGHNSTAEVTIEDVVNSEDIDIYREIAGGVTTSQLLHGSANPIGGRSAIVKWKWGAAPEELLYKNQPKFIKFALGENVKQANWGISNPTRFPQTRMGVEQVFTDYFQRAKEYDESWKKYNSSSKKDKLKAPRVDIELQTLAEILNKERFITCHSYVQSEILMLMNVAEKFNFRVNTFTHILEGYKVADKMKEHGVGASTFSDWWAYKFEVNDAIPYNGPIMHNAGVVVAYNSDNAEMSRRLNQEAAKAVKYGDISEEEAWKFVTLNPAKLLHIDDKVGSIKVGKDADMVLWSDNPLSIYAKVEKTLIEGTVYFDSQKDDEKRNELFKVRNEIVGQMLEEKNKGINTQEPKKKVKKEYQCDTLEN